MTRNIHGYRRVVLIVAERRYVVFQIEIAYPLDKRWDCRSCNKCQWSSTGKCNMWNTVGEIAIPPLFVHIGLQQVLHIPLFCIETGSSCDNLDGNKAHCCKCKRYYQEMALGIPMERDHDEYRVPFLIRKSFNSLHDNGSNVCAICPWVYHQLMKLLLFPLHDHILDILVNTTCWNRVDRTISLYAQRYPSFQDWWVCCNENIEYVRDDSTGQEQVWDAHGVRWVVH